MTLNYVEHAPREIKYVPDPGEVAERLRPADVQHIVEIFQTPLTGSYNWDYEVANEKLRRLYRLGKTLNWDAELDVQWEPAYPKSKPPAVEAMNPFAGYAPFEKFGEAERLEFGWHNQSWLLSQFMHGEQGALLVASQLVSCGPTYDAKLYAASQTFDEARHVEVFSKYLHERVGFSYPINANLKFLLDKILTDPRWDLKFIGMQIIVEGLALAAFHTMQLVTLDPVLKSIVDLVIRDEARHVAFGVIYLEDFVKSLSAAEREERATFAYEACCVMRERLIATDVFEHFGWDVEDARRVVLQAQVMEQFRNLLFTRIMPNLKKIGLLTDSVRPLYEQLGILQYENFVDDGMIDWAKLEQPLKN